MGVLGAQPERMVWAMMRKMVDDMARSLKYTVFCVNMGSKKYFIEKKICKVIELGKLYTSMIFFSKNLNSIIGEYAKNRAKRVNKILSFPAAPSLNGDPGYTRS